MWFSSARRVKNAVQVAALYFVYPNYTRRQCRRYPKGHSYKSALDVEPIVVVGFPHTMASKLAGLLLFIAVPMVFWSIVPIAIVAGVATFAAIQEGHFIRTRKGMICE